MRRAVVTSPGQVLATLADLAPDTAADRDVFVRSIDRAILPFDAVNAFAYGGMPTNGVSAELADETGQRILPYLRKARLHDDDRLRIGWLWVTGLDDDRNRIRFPLVSAAVRHRGVVDRMLGNSVVRLRDREVTDLIADPTTRDRLEATIEYGGGASDHSGNDFIDPRLLSRMPRLRAWALEAAAAAGFPTQSFVSGAEGDEPSQPGAYEVRAQLAVYLATPSRRSATVAATLRAWPTGGLDHTAFATCYGLDADEPSSPSREPVVSPLVLSRVQRDVLLAARTEPLTVISGPPGTGKSHTIAALALDEVARGRSVLVAAPTEAAVDALADLLADVPGPDPLVFGSSDRREVAADRLGQGGGALVGDDVVDRAAAALRMADDAADEVRRAVLELLTAEQLAAGADPASTFAARRVAPRWFDGADLDEAERLYAHVVDAATGWFAGFRRRRREARLAAHAGATTDDVAALGRALTVARAARHVHELELTGGLDLVASWRRLVQLEDERRRRHGEWQQAAAHSESRVGRSERAIMSAVATALRAGRLTRRRKLAELDGHRLTRAFPLWVGTLRDIDDLLPPTPAMFDVVIVDEASQVDQIMAAPALLRARRAVVVGDPKQLRHVSFLSERATSEAIAGQGIDDPHMRALLDVRRMSLFDVAASRAPTRFLDEHFRSAPHLIGFSARRFYDGALGIATTHPANHARDCISVQWVGGRRDDDGVNHDEIDAVIGLIRQRQEAARRGSPTGIGVVAPFRAQADAIENRIVTEFELEEIDELDLRVGTVHGFQGCERDLVIVSLAVDASSTGSQRAFVNDRNLFNVMVTRPREELIVVTSLDRDTPGLIGEYLRYGDAPPPVPASVPPSDPVARRVADDLRSQGIDVHTGYRTGRHVVDLVLGHGDQALGVCFGVHPDGPEAHVDRHLALVRAGWTLREVFDTAWGDRSAELAVDLAVDARRRAG